ncbi:hypothetical protein J4U02_gp049 [Mycobacterium phage Aziz]|uniref:Uncharacterized protein n=1 Tax=Mycobacterium phage Aziz TaxID=2762281 RepID=A0A7G8LHI7_9CAUD|nr:hypothetical protein J4U02_gp049 [Mycobacterium phage Aziz]ASR75896.1 hypothetical protein SEA_GENEVAB15_49 [Mycobacterium phage GenevaB15]QNJ56709.1 hypothetical protein SEA_AZIZ_49 [Mycobacterium phage Aziz]
MSVKLTHEITLSSPLTLADMEQFVAQAKEMGVRTTATLSLQITKGYSDFRESWPDAVTITARR